MGRIPRTGGYYSTWVWNDHTNISSFLVILFLLGICWGLSFRFPVLCPWAPGFLLMLLMIPRSSWFPSVLPQCPVDTFLHNINTVARIRFTWCHESQKWLKKGVVWSCKLGGESFPKRTVGPGQRVQAPKLNPFVRDVCWGSVPLSQIHLVIWYYVFRYRDTHIRFRCWWELGISLDVKTLKFLKLLVEFFESQLTFHRWNRLVTWISKTGSWHFRLQQIVTQVYNVNFNKTRDPRAC